MYEDIGHSNEARKTMKKYLIGNLEVCSENALIRSDLNTITIICLVSCGNRII